MQGASRNKKFAVLLQKRSRYWTFFVCLVLVIGLLPLIQTMAGDKAPKKTSLFQKKASKKTTPLQRMATIVVSETSKGNPKKILYTPRIIFSPGRRASIKIGSECSSFQLSIDSTTTKGQLCHFVEIEAIQKGKSPKNLLELKMLVLDGSKEMVSYLQPGGSSLKVEIDIEPVTVPRAGKNDASPRVCPQGKNTKPSGNGAARD